MSQKLAIASFCDIRYDGAMRKKGKEITQDILFLLATGAIFTAALVAPPMIRFAPALMRHYKNLQKAELRRKREAMRRLKQRKFVEVFQKDGEPHIRITKDGKNYIGKYEIDNLELSKREKWDGVWRVILSDIPEDKKKARDALRHHFRRLGLCPVQKSVWAYPFECENEIDTVTEFFGVNRHVAYLNTSDLGGLEAKARKYFDIGLG